MSAFVFAPDPLLTVTVEAGADGDEIHLHAGGAVPSESAGRRLRCLVTNDDGIDSEGLRVLALVALEAGLEVVVAAPMQECSGASASITAVEQDGRFLVEPRTIAGLEAADAVLAVGGLPPSSP